MNQRRETRPEEVLSQTAGGLGEPGDAADQAVRLRLLMEAEAVDEGRAGRVWDPSIECVPYPLEDVEDVLTMEGDWVGRFNGKIIDEKVERPTDIDEFLSTE